MGVLIDKVDDSGIEGSAVSADEIFNLIRLQSPLVLTIKARPDGSTGGVLGDLDGGPGD